MKKKIILFPNNAIHTRSFTKSDKQSMPNTISLNSEIPYQKSRCRLRILTVLFQGLGRTVCSNLGF